LNRRTEAPITPLTDDQKDLAARHVHLCRLMAMRFGRRCPGLYADLRQAAAEGLCDAARKFDPARGARFSTYAFHRMEGACLDMMRTNGLVRGPRRRHRGPPAFLSIDREPDAGGGAADGRRWDSLLPPAADPDPSDRLEAHDQFEGWLRGLPEREKTLLRLRYAPERASQRAIGLALGISEARVSQVLDGVLARLRAEAHLPHFRALRET